MGRYVHRETRQDSTPEVLGTHTLVQLMMQSMQSPSWSGKASEEGFKGILDMKRQKTSQELRVSGKNQSKEIYAIFQRFKWGRKAMRQMLQTSQQTRGLNDKAKNIYGGLNSKYPEGKKMSPGSVLLQFFNGNFQFTKSCHSDRMVDLILIE